MIPFLFIQAILAGTLIELLDNNPAANTRATQGLEIGIRGSLDSQINVRFVAIPGKRFVGTLLSTDGAKVKVEGILRAKPKGDFVLELDVVETKTLDRVKTRSLTTDVNLREKTLFCHGWVWWYEITLTPPR